LTHPTPATVQAGARSSKIGASGSSCATKLQTAATPRLRAPRSKHAAPGLRAPLPPGNTLECNLSGITSLRSSVCILASSHRFDGGAHSLSGAAAGLVRTWATAAALGCTRLHMAARETETLGYACPRFRASTGLPSAIHLPFPPAPPLGAGGHHHPVPQMQHGGGLIREALARKGRALFGQSDYSHSAFSLTDRRHET